MSGLNYFYDQQLRRYTQQFMRVFSGFKVKHFTKGQETFRRVPVMYGDISRMAGTILKQNSENMLLSAPFISCYTTTFRMDKERRQNPSHERKVRVTEREYTEEHGYSGEKGTSFTVESFMPVPYELEMVADIWTTNRDDKDQLLEQILVLFNPSIDLQTSTNAVDWTSLSIIELEDIQWSSRNIPQGIDDQMDVARLSFKMPIWINPPSKVKKQTIIHQIVAQINDDTGTLNDGALGNRDETTFDNFKTMFDFGIDFDEDSSDGDRAEDVQDVEERMIITPGDHHIEVDGNEIILLGPGRQEINPTTDDVYDWSELLAQYGDLIPGASRIRIRPPGMNLENWDYDFIGRISLHETEKNRLHWALDVSTLPRDTLSAIDSIVDPTKHGPEHGLAPARAGQRYLLIDDIASTNIAWGSVKGKENDIIEFDGTKWDIVFESKSINTVNYAINKFNSDKIKWDGREWTVIPDGEYAPGFWRIRL